MDVRGVAVVRLGRSAPPQTFAKRQLLVVALAACVAPFPVSPAAADVVRDGSLGADLPLGGGAGTFIIEEFHGERSGANLFHSFLEFDLASDQSAIFRGSSSIQNVISRVTGDDPSLIAGTIRSEIPGAHLFLINPRGVTFTETAQLDANSFHVTTADYLELGSDGAQRFFADPALPSVLAPTEITAFGFLGAPLPASITVEDSALVSAPFGNLSLIGGDLMIRGGPLGLLLAPGGRIALVSVGSAGEVDFDVADPFAAPDTSSFGALGAISLDDFAFVGVAAPGFDAGRIHVRGDSLEMAAGSTLVADDGFLVFGVAFGGEAGGLIDLGLRGRLGMSGGSVLDTQATFAGIVSVAAGEVELRDPGTRITNSTFEESFLGSIRVLATGDVTVDDEAEIVSRTFGPGTGPWISIDAADTLRVELGFVGTAALDDGDAGDLSLRADAVEILTLGAVGSSSQTLTATSMPSIAGTGDVFVEARSLLVDGGLLFNAIESAGISGDISIEADEVTVDHDGRIAASTSDPGFLADFGLIGHGGDVIVDARAVRVEGASFLGALSTPLLGVFPSFGDAGDVSVTASESISVLGASTAFEDASEIASTSSGGPLLPNVGAAGDVTLDAAGGTLLLRSGHVRSNSFRSLGDSGDISVTARELDVFDASLISSSSDLANSGDLVIQGVTRAVIDGSDIQTLTQGEGAAGDLTLRISDLAARDARIQANAGLGDAGRLTLDVDRLALREGSSVGASTLFSIAADGSIVPGNGAGGLLEIIARESVLVSGAGGSFDVPSSITNVNFDGTGGTLRIETPELIVEDQAFIETSTFGSGPASAIAFDVQRLLVRSGSRIAADTAGETPGLLPPSTGMGGSIDIDASGFIRVEGITQISASTLGFGDAGTLSVRAPLLELSNGGLLLGFTASEGGGRGGDISIDVGTLRATGESSQINVSTTFAEGADPALVTGSAGDLTVRANEVLISGERSGLQSKSQTAGNGGSIDVNARRLDVRDGGLITATAELSGAAGSIVIGPGDGGYPTEQVWLSDAEITAFANVGPTPGEPREGNIAISARDLIVLKDGSRVTSSVGSGLGGNVSISDAELLVLEGGSEILAETQDGTGGSISLSTRGVIPQLASIGTSVLESDDFISGVSGARISADAGTGTAGVIAAMSPEVDIESQVTALDVAFLETQGITSACAARASGEAGSFQVARFRGLPASPEELLLAFDEPEPNDIDGPLGGRAGDPGSAGDPAARSLSSGTAALRDGKAEQAEEQFASALAALGPDGDAGLRSDSLRGIGQAQQAQGHFGESRESLEAALALAQQAGDAEREARVLSLLGSTQVAMHEPLEAERTLLRGLGIAKQAGQGGLASQLESNLGNDAATQQEWRAALTRYEAAAVQARAAGHAEQEAMALASAGRAAIEMRELERAQPLLAGAEAALARPSGAATVHLGIHLGKSYAQLAQLEADAPRRAHLRRAQQHLRSAAAGAEALGDARLRSFALGNLGSLYEQEHRLSEALYLTRQALELAEASESPDALYRWHWQEGRILWSQGKAEPALAALRRAVEIVEATRQVSLAHYGSAALRFERAVAPVYRDYVAALLRSSQLVAANPKASQRLLNEARDTLEQYQAAELRDYFRDECVADIEARTLDLDRVLRERSPRTAVVYPIPLEERLEILVSLPGGAERFVVPVSAAALNAEVARFRTALTEPMTLRYQPFAEQLHRWLVAPYQARLAEKGIDTLVFVPGGSLRTIPFGALSDGERFLLENYAVAVTPGLSLVDPRSLDARSGRFLLAGLSVGGTFGGKQFEALPKVSEEIGAIRKLYGGDVLLDAGFEGARFQRAVVEGEPTVVHVASHAYFGSGPDDSYLLTHDGAVTFDQLGAVVGPRRYTDAPLELLVLSACETAVGDDRAALGLAGVAIRSGARSALGSLWPISDEAAFEVMTGFYQRLQEPQVSKARALQQAQLALLRPDSAYRHPYYWSPYLLISNWL